MAYFGESLVGVASEWFINQDISHWHVWDDMAQAFIKHFQYNIDIAPDRNSLSNMKKKPTESFREYAIKWREQAARVKSPMDNHELITVFLEAQEPDYFQNMISAMGRPFAEAIKIGDMVENGLLAGRIKLKQMGVIGLIAPHHMHPDSHGFKANARYDYHLGAPGHNTDDCWTLKRAIERLIAEKLIVVTNGEDPPNMTINPLPVYNDVHFVGIIGRDQEYKPVGQAEMTAGTIQERTKLEVSPREDVSMIVKGAPSLEKATLFVPNVSRLEVCSNFTSPRLYILGGHLITRQNKGGTSGIIEPIIIKPTIQPHVANTKIIPWNYNKIVVTYKGKEIIEEVGETGEEHARVLIKILNEAHISEKTTVNQLEKVANRFFEVNKISFTDEELPEEGAGHNRALHLIIKYEGHYVKRVMVDEGSSVDNSRPDLKKLSNFEIMHQEVKYDENEAVEEIKRELEQFENKPRPNLNETEPINIGGHEEVRETKLSIHAEQETRDALIQILFEYRDVFSWSYDDMPGLSADLVVHKLPTYPDFPPV
ncbi:uncharacterized protein [Nicotiana tomentosiformis]|uniref:uncharacterized protein n=1 Tax=Nicotiana tomentosiformis TaxID=4098 RepID=UPI00388C43DA